MSRSKALAVKYLAAAVSFFGVMTLAGLLSATYYINPDFLFGYLHFSTAKMLHIDTMIIWLLMGFMGAVYWFLPDEFGCEPAGIAAAEILFWVFVAAVLVVAAIFLFVQWRPDHAMAVPAGPQIRRGAALGRDRHRRGHARLRLECHRHSAQGAPHDGDHGGDEREHGAAGAALSHRAAEDR
jgi:nitric oxide reductase large subunit